MATKPDKAIITADPDVSTAKAFFGNLIDYYNEKTDSQDSHFSSTSNPHAVTATQVGLGNVANTAQVELSTVTTVNDFIVGSGNATVTRKTPTEVATILSAVVGNSAGIRITIGTTAPLSPVNDKELWIDTTNKVMRVYSNAAWITLGSAYSA